jgi:adenosylcobinamide-phosphate synthase
MPGELCAIFVANNHCRFHIMSLSALIAALLLEQLNALAEHKSLRVWMKGYVGFFQHHFNSGAYQHGRAAWWLAALPVVVGAVLLFWWLHHLHPILSWAFNVLAMYLGMGFRKYSQIYTDIQLALRSADIQRARALLSTLRGKESDEMGIEEIARLAIEAILMVALHRLFAVIVWFVVFGFLGLGGAAGALLYGLGMAMHDAEEAHPEESGASYAQKMRIRMDWLPIRLTAATFAIVGNFEDTAYCWRSQAASWQDSEEGILLASAAGASGVRLGYRVQDTGRPELGVGDKSGAEALYCIGRLLWRSAAFMLLVLFMLTLAGLLR